MVKDLDKQLFEPIRKRLIEARKAQSLSQEALAAKSDVERVAIGYIEQGRRRPTLPTLYRLSKALGMKLEDLIKNL